MRYDETQNSKEKKDLSRLFNLNNILSQIASFAAYIIAILSAGVLIYISFVETFDIHFDWVTLTIFSVLAVSLAWLNWNAFYRQRYEKTMSDDIAQHEFGRYSIHARYYNCVKDWDDASLQIKVDDFNERFIRMWLNWVEQVTGHPIETKEEVQIKDGQPVLDENGKPKIIVTKGIKDLSYWKFKHPIIMWRIKTHHYPKSGYRSAIELMSLLSFQETNLSKRDLYAAKRFYVRKSLTKAITAFGIIGIGGSIIPEMVSGNIWAAILKLILALGTLCGSIFMGAINGVRGARLKLSIVEVVCQDLEKWSDKKPVLDKYTPIDTNTTTNKVDNNQKKAEEPFEVAEQIFNSQNMQLK